MTKLTNYCNKVDETAQFLRNKFTNLPHCALIAGTGLGNITQMMEIDGELDYQTIPNFPISTVNSHAGKLIIGKCANQPLIVFNGRFHLYEGYTPWEVTFPLRVLAQCGLQQLIITNAAGGLNSNFATGDIMLITDHINMMGDNPLTGSHTPNWGERFPDMSKVYDTTLAQLAEDTAKELNSPLKKGIYVAVKGPSLETPAETRMYKLLGADAIGMSTAQEAIVAVQQKIKILAFSVITNINNPDNMQQTSLQEIIECATKSSKKLTALLTAILKKLPKEK